MTHLNTEKPTLTWNAADLAACRRGQTVGLHERGGVTKGVTLIDRELIQDEIGGTVHAPTDISCEIVEGDVWVKKELHLDSAYARGAELCFCADILEPKTRDKGLRATLNGVSLRYTCVRNLPRPFSGRCTPREFRSDNTGRATGIGSRSTLSCSARGRTPSCCTPRAARGSSSSSSLHVRPTAARSAATAE